MHPFVAGSGNEALNLIHEGYRFDVAILDMHMPEMDGLTLARHIQEYHNDQPLARRTSLPLVMLTSVDRRVADIQAVDVQFAAYMTKPIKPSDLYNALATIFAQEQTTHNTNGSYPVGNTYGKTFSDINGTEWDYQLGKRHPLRILLAEDNVVNQKVALNVLERVGYQVDIAANGQEVLSALERQLYDVVLMDVQMPYMDGLETTQQIRARWPQERQPRIIAMTADALLQVRQECFAAGMDDYISKPVRVQQLTNVLRQCEVINGSKNRHAINWPQ